MTRSLEGIAAPPQVGPTEVFYFFFGREPNKSEMDSLNQSQNRVGFLVNLLNSAEFKNTFASSPRLREIILDIFSEYDRELNEDYTHLCSNLRKNIFPAGGSTDCGELVFMGYFLCLHRHPDPVGFCGYTKKLKSDELTFKAFVGALLSSGEAQAVFPNYDVATINTISDLSNGLTHKSRSANIIV